MLGQVKHFVRALVPLFFACSTFQPFPSSFPLSLSCWFCSKVPQTLENSYECGPLHVPKSVPSRFQKAFIPPRPQFQFMTAIHFDFFGRATWHAETASLNRVFDLSSSSSKSCSALLYAFRQVPFKNQETGGMNDEGQIRRPLSFQDCKCICYWWKGIMICNFPLGKHFTTKMKHSDRTINKSLSTRLVLYSRRLLT